MVKNILVILEDTFWSLFFAVPMTLSKMTLSIMTFNIKTLSIKTVSIKTLSIMTFIMILFNIKSLIITINKHNIIAECCVAEYHLC